MTRRDGDRIGANPPMVHPGPAALQRRSVASSRIQTFLIPVEPAQSVEEAVRRGFDAAGLTSGCVLVDGLVCEPLRYVIPAEPDDPSRLAWYSGIRSPEGDCLIAEGYMSVGQDGGALFTHCHGIWHLPDGRAALGHLDSHGSVAAEPCELRAIGFADAIFDRRHDQETGFQLFTTLPLASSAATVTPGAVALTLRPNEDIVTAVEEICALYEIRSARVHGLGSLNGAEFADGSRMDGAITEFLIRSGHYRAEAGAKIDLAAVDVTASMFTGVAVRGKATVSVTAEIVLVPDG